MHFIRNLLSMELKNQGDKKLAMKNPTMLIFARGIETCQCHVTFQGNDIASVTYLAVNYEEDKNRR